MPRLTTEAALRAAETIAEAWTSGATLAPFPPEMAPSTPAQGRRVATQVLRILGAPIVGLRLAPAPGAPRRIPGPLLGSRLVHAPATATPAAGPAPTFTLALVAQLSSRLTPSGTGWTAAAALGCLASVHVAIDRADSRYTQGAADLACHLADLAGLGLVVFGKPTPSRAALTLTQESRASLGTWRGTVDVASVLIEAANAASAEGGLPEGAVLCIAGLSPGIEMASGVLEARIGGIGTARITLPG